MCLCVVLAVGDTDVTVTYLATFKGHKKLPEGIDKTMFYPFLPAPKEDKYDPLPAMAVPVPPKEGWASLRKKYTIPKASVSLISLPFLASSISHIMDRSGSY